MTQVISCRPGNMKKKNGSLIYLTYVDQVEKQKLFISLLNTTENYFKITDDMIC